MRPTKLIMSAFGPYAGEVTIDMDALGERGLYLVTGDTGAGKTTIFDAITYALFGEASGNVRSQDMFRSKYATDATPTYVELEFVLRGDTYKVRRNPEYMRKSKRGEGKFTKELAGAELTLPDGKVITKVNAVTDKVKEIIGLDRNQFTQIAMIAQGDFLRLLLAGTKERSAIFREIFNTRPYQVLQDKLKMSANGLYGQIADGRKSIKQYFKDTKCSEDSDNFGVLESFKENDKNDTEEITNLLKIIIVEDSDKKEKLEEKIAHLDKEIAEINGKLGKAEHVNSAYLELKKSRDEVQIFEPKRVMSEKILAAEIEKNPYREKLASQIEIEKNNMDGFKALTAIDAEIKDCENTEKTAQNQLSLSLQKQEILTEQIKKRTEKLQSIKNCDVQLEKKQSQKKEMAETGNGYAALEKASKECREIISSYKEKLKIYKDTLSKYEQAKADRDACEISFLDAQAGILADTLEAGKPCPVCGSTLHPTPAVKLNAAPTQEQLNMLKRTADMSQQLCEKNRALAAGEKGRMDTTFANVLVMAGESSTIEGTEERLVWITSAEEKANVQKSELMEKFKVLKTEIAVLEKQVERKAELEEMEQTDAENMKVLQEKIAELTSVLSGIKEKKAGFIIRRKDAVDKLSFASEGEAKAHIEAMEKEKLSLEKALEEARINLENAKLLENTAKQRVADYTKQLEGEKETDTTELKELLENKTKEKKLELTNSEEAGYRITLNLSAVKSIEKAASVIKKQEEKWKWVNSLANTANAGILGKDRVMLETYVQMAFFDRIIERANVRLMKMTAGQYDLSRSKVAANLKMQSGLELDVIDHYNGTTRSVKTLSGGESFKASLALALGLSEEIQSQAGGISVDTMFVDEGFGSLDEESLSQAIDTLMGLSQSNRLVGIISHVDQLKERIDRQIVVEKQKTGGSDIKLIF